VGLCRFANVLQCGWSFLFLRAEEKNKIKNCSFPSFRERMLEVYPSNWKGFKGQKWVPKKKEKPKYIR